MSKNNLVTISLFGKHLFLLVIKIKTCLVRSNLKNNSYVNNNNHKKLATHNTLKSINFSKDFKLVMKLEVSLPACHK